MSTGFGVNKGKDGKYNTLNLTQYKGRSTDPSKPSGASGVRHGLQSLGKVASTRRVPPPASLPSLKSENLGNDPNINLVPKDGTGWASKNETSSQTPTTQSQATEPPPKPAPTTYSQQAQSQTTSASRNQNSTNPPQPSNASQSMWGPSRHTQHGNKVSAAAGGGQARGTTHFSDDFPTLGDTHKEQQSGQSADQSREPQYGPGPSLRPQNVASWRDGGGRTLPVPQSNESHVVSEDNKKMEQQPLVKAVHPQHVYEGSDINQNQPIPHPMGQPPRQPQHYPPNMMPPYMYNRFAHPGMAPPGPGPRYPVGMQQRMRYPPFVNDPRYRNMMMATQQQQESLEKSSTISQSNMKDFDKFENDDGDEGWATMHGEVDYGEKLVFSDDEDGNGTKSRNSSTQDNRKDRHELKKTSPVPTQAWGATSASLMEGPTAPAWAYNMYPTPSTVEARSTMQPPYEKRIPPQGQMYGGPPMQHSQMYAHHATPMGQRFSQRPMPDVSATRASPSGEDEQWRKSEKEEAMERARKRKEEESRRMEMERASHTPDQNVRHYEGIQAEHEQQRFLQNSESLDEKKKTWGKQSQMETPMGAYRGRRTESESSEERRMAWPERPPGDGFGGYRSVPHPSTSQNRNLPPRLAQQRQERMVQRSGQVNYEQAWSSMPQQGIRPSSIMKRERRESEDSEDHQKGYRSRQQSESSQSYGRATPDEDRHAYQPQDTSRKDERKLGEGQRSFDNRSPSVADQRLWDAGTSKSSSRQTSRDASTSNDSRRGSLKTLLTRSDSGGRSNAKRGSSQLEKSENKEEYKQHETVKPRRMDNKVKLRDFRVESDQEDNNTHGSKTDRKSSKTGSQLSSAVSFGENKIWNNDKVNKPIATVSPSTTSTTVTRSEVKHDPLTKSITRDVGPTDGSQTSANVVGSDRNRERNRSYNTGSARSNRDRKQAPRGERKYDSHKGEADSDPDSGAYPAKTFHKTTHVHSERSRDSAYHGEREHKEGGRNQRRGDKTSESRYHGDSKYKREYKDSRRDSKRDHTEHKGRTSAPVRKQEINKVDAEKQAHSKDKKTAENAPVKPASIETKQKSTPAPPATNIWEERKKQMQKDVKSDKNLTYIPTEEDKKRTLKETAPVINVNEAESKTLSVTDHSGKNTKSSNRDRSNFSGDKIEDTDRKGGKKYKDNSYRRGGSNVSTGGDRWSQDRSYTSERYERRGSRGRGRSHGIRGRGTAPVPDKFVSAPRGRGQRRGGRSVPSRGYDHSYSSSRYANKNENTDSYEYEEYSESDNETPFVSRRRKEASTDDNYSDSDNDQVSAPVKLTVTGAKNSRAVKSSDSAEITFTARGEPSRRGRGRGALSSSHRGRGRQPANGLKSNSPPRSANGRGRRMDNSQHQETSRVPKNGERGPYGPGADDRRKHGSRNNDKRKRKTKPDQPPRFKNSSTIRKPSSSEVTQSGGFQKSDGGVQPSSDVEWETASEDNNTDVKKATSKDGNRSKTDSTRHSHPRTQSRRGRGGKGGMNDRYRDVKEPVRATDSQVYVLHTVDYTYPSAIEGAIRDASATQQEKAKKLENDQKAKNKELFRRYDLHNYAGVVNVDDLPDVSSQGAVQPELTVSEDLLSAVLDSTPVEDKDDEDGFTPVLSKRSQKKKQEKIRKKDKESQAGENYRKLRSEQQRQTKNKLIAKSLNGLKSGSSGSVKQTLPATAVSSITADSWLNTIDTWDPLDVQKKVQQSSVEPGISQHDSGVESSVPSSQRSSPGTEAKLSFSHFATTMTSTSVITSICNHEVPMVGPPIQRNSDILTNPSNIGMSSYVEAAAAQSPNRVVVNPIGPIGQERSKSVKRSDSVENITSLYHQESNAISFIADEPEENQGKPSSPFFTPEDLRSSSFPPYPEPPSALSDHSQHFTGFPAPDFPDGSVTPDMALDSTSSAGFHQIADFSHGAGGASDLTRSRNSTASNESFSSHTVKRNNYGNIVPMQQTTSLAKFVDGQNMETSIPTSSVTVLVGKKAGAYPDSDPIEDMSLTPPNTTNPNVTHSKSLEGPIPAPIPMPPTHPPTSKQGHDVDTKNGIRQTHDVNPDVSVASELGLLTPTSPSLDFNLKMESARKAWENMPESSTASTLQQQNMDPNQGHSFHTSTTATSASESPVPNTAVQSMSSVKLSVTKSSEWKPRHLVDASSSSTTDDPSWTSSVQQTAVSQVATQEMQENIASPAATTSITDAAKSVHMSVYGGVDAGLVTSTQPQSLQVTSQFGNNPYMYMDIQQSQLMQHPQRLVQGSQSALYQQPISTTSLATNLQQMQQIYNNYPPEYAQSLYSAPGYNSLSQQHQSSGYNTQPYLASTAVGSPAASMKSTQQQQAPAVRSGGLPNYGTSSAVPGQQANLGSTQLAVPRPHSGAPSPAQQMYVPLVEQNRVATQGSSVTLVNQQLSVAPRAQSTSFYNQLNQGGSANYYTPQTQLRQTPYQPTTMQVSQPLSYQQYPQSIKGMSPTSPNQLGLEHTASLNANMPSSYAPIAPPSQRLRSDAEYNQYYSNKNPQYSTTKMPPPPAQGVFGAMKSSMPSSGSFGGAKSNSMYVPPNMSGTQEHISSTSMPIQKYAMSNTPGIPSTVGKATVQSGGDWSKTQTSQQFRGNSVQGILSRPFSSSGDSLYQHSPSVQSNYASKSTDMSGSNMGLAFPMQSPQQIQSFNTTSSWNSKMVGPHGNSMPSPHSGAGILGKAPPRPVMPVMAPQRFTVAQPYQSNMVSQQVPSFRGQMPFQVAGGMKPQTSQLGSVHDITQGSYQPINKQNKPMSRMNTNTKAPPVPTLVRGSGSTLMGKKPTYMPEEVVKSNQANERANLLQSLSAFFPDNQKKADDPLEEKPTDWSTQVANSSPLPKRKPGMRHPGVDRRKLMNKNDRGDDKSKRSGPIGVGKGVKRLQKNGKKDDIDSEAVNSVTATAKKLTLADTQPKKGEVAKIK